MSKNHTNTCYDCIHLAACYKIEHYGRDMGTNTPCDLYIGISDRIKIVRCKDCKYYKTGKDYEPYCNHINGLDEAKDNDFCSYGERKEYGNG